jgi:exonuclease III
MKIVTWNCNLRLKDKFENLAALSPDISIVQECEFLPESFFPGARYLWTGIDPKKGLGVIDFTDSANVDKSHDESLAFFLPVNLDSGKQKLLATWAFNHRATNRFGPEYAGQPLKAFSHYHQWMEGGDLIVAGDFNNSVVWDKPEGKNNFDAIASTLSNYGLASAYHAFNKTASGNKTAFGEESHATFYHTKKLEKPYHIDYVFIKNTERIKDMWVGGYDEWIKLSDHVPVMVEVNRVA